MIKFKRVAYRNFLSAGDTGITIRLDKSPTTLITGANGTGKTTMIEAITFALFGKSFRQINKPQLVNSLNGKGCHVEIEFTSGSDEYIVTRGIAPHIFTIEKNGTKISQDADVRDYQNHLEQNIIKMSYKAFTQVIVIGSSNFTPFMELSAVARREVVETILDISIFSDMNNILKGRMAVWKESVIKVDSAISGLMESIKIQKGFIDTMKFNVETEKERRKNKEAELNSHIENVKTRLLALKAEYSAITGFLSDMDENAGKLSKFIQERGQKDYQIQETESKIRFFREETVCPTCSQNISQEHSCDSVLEMSNRIGILASDLEHIVREIARFEVIVGAQKESKDRLADVNAEIRNLTSNFTSLKKQLEELNAIEIPQESDIQEATMKLREMAALLQSNRKEQQALSEQREVYETASLLLKDSGVKKTIIKQYIPIINKLVNKYLHLMNFFIKFEIDAEFNEKIRSKSREEFSYRSFSMGERARIDLALLFTWREVARMKNSINTNLLFFDEVFDSSLDGAGAEDLMAILDESLGQDTNVFVISHRGDSLADKLRSHIHFDKEKGFSKIANP